MIHVWDGTATDFKTKTVVLIDGRETEPLALVTEQIVKAWQGKWNQEKIKGPIND